eukprot:15440897-Alexandrium_andersonii.AAC.1
MFVEAFRMPGSLLVVAIGLGAHIAAGRSPRELRGPILRSSLGPRSSSSECQKPLFAFSGG